jgi:glucose-6-phosphate isomerase
MPPEPLETSAGRALVAHRDALAATTIGALFAADPTRPTTMSLSVGDLVVDLSRHHATPETLGLLAGLADECGLRRRANRMFGGDVVNVTEGRAALHTALRAPRGEEVRVDGVDVVPGVHRELDRMESFTQAVHDGTWRGVTGRPLSTVVNIGIGGSDLGPRMAARALHAFRHPGVDVHFVSNVDPDDLDLTLADLDPSTTLVVVVSKTFTTQETMTNAQAARRWLVEALGADAPSRHVVAVTTALDLAREFGVDDDAVFGFWDWVGGRYSLPSAVGLSLMLAVGPEHTAGLRAGMRLVDEHFRDAPYDRNAPALMGLLTVWYSTFGLARSKAVVPYSTALGLLPSYLQQLVMESNGKSVTEDGEPVDHQTSPVVWGAAGTDGQHAFFQLLHQGTPHVPVDFIGFARATNETDERQTMLLSNLLAQPAALAFGRSADELRAAGVPENQVPHRVMPGNRPSTVILAPALTPSVLGQLIALYEHAVLTEATVWGIDPFDQWGVELGKQLARSVLPALAEGAQAAESAALDPATRAGVELLLAWRRLSR